MYICSYKHNLSHITTPAAYTLTHKNRTKIIIIQKKFFQDEIINQIWRKGMSIFLDQAYLQVQKKKSKLCEVYVSEV